MAEDRGLQAWGRGDCKEAENAFEQAENTAQKTGAVPVADEDRNFLRWVDAFLCLGSFEDARNRALKAESVIVSPKGAVAQLHFLLAEAEKGLGSYSEAEAVFKKANNEGQQALPGDRPQMSRLWAAWSELARLEGRLPQAEDYGKNASLALNGPPSPTPSERAYVDVVAGDLALEKGPLSEARKFYTEARGFWDKESRHPIAARASLGLGLLELAEGRLDLAGNELERAWAAAVPMPASDLYLQAQDARGMLELAKGNLATARDCFSKNLADQNRGERHPSKATSSDHLGLVLLAEQNFDQAIVSFKSAARIQQDALGLDHPDRAATLQHLGRAYRLKGDFVNANSELVQAFGIQSATLGKGSLAAAGTRLEQAQLSDDQGKLPEAESFCREALSDEKELETTPAILYLATVRELALILHREGNPEAEPLITKWMEARGKLLPPLDPERLPIATAAAEIALKAGKYADAEKQFRDILGAKPPALYAVKEGLAEALFSQGKLQDAIPHYEAALPNLGDPTREARGWKNLANCYAAQKQWPDDIRAAQKALGFATNDEERRSIVLTIVEASGETGQPGAEFLDRWLTMRATPPSPLTADEVRILVNSVRLLKTAHDYARAETVLQLLLGDAQENDHSPVNVNQAWADFADVSAAQNKTTQAAAAYEKLAKRIHRPADAEPYLLKAKAQREKDADPVASLRATLPLAEIYLKENKYPEAQQLLTQASEVLKAHGLADGARYAETLIGLGSVAQHEMHLEDAELFFGKAEDLLKKNPNATFQASVLFNLGNLKLAQGKKPEAAAYFDRCLALAQTAKFTQDDPPPVEEFDSIALAYNGLGQPGQAEKLLKSNLDLSQKFFKGDLEEGWVWYDLTNFYNGKDYKEAALAGEHALKIFASKAGPESDEVGLILSMLAGVYYSQKDYEHAIEDATKSAEIQERLQLPPEERAITLTTWGEVCFEGRKYDKALLAYQELAGLYADHKSDAHKDDYRNAKQNVVKALVYLGRNNDAKIAQRALLQELKGNEEALNAAKKSYASALQESPKKK